MLTICILIAIIAYLIGSINFSVILSKKMAGFDVRQKGSGNAGTTNMLRSVGKKAAAITLICDILKGVVSIGIAILVGYLFNAQNKSILVQIAAIAVVIGHTFPIFFGFKGGKGVATSLGVLIMTNWQIGLICLAIAIIIMAITKMVSLGSCMAAIAFPLLTYFAANIFENAYIVKEGSSYFVYSIILAVIVLFNHRSNIKRIITGKENKLSFKKERTKE
ncbi:glycerol-3-phosphate acyltransferase [Clostridium sp. CAG:440]|jgi:glycerol-3-phosphate acyltransferase PlsY|nr:glycerol-3-phosphate acyltransferase [Clostridium sp. CAG:440]HJJ16131.1 glycerol-3-phosphate 1-O-acyltransferase PlsY [Clostridiaceae bacterium]